MKNAFSRIGYTCASILFAGGLMTAVTPANAEMHDLAYVTLSQPTEVGSTTLPSGKYTISTLNNDVYLIRSENGEGAMVMGRRVETNDESPRTEVVLKNDGEGFRLDQLRIEGESQEYEFAK
jgi:hypothetical protein